MCYPGSPALILLTPIRVGFRRWVPVVDRHEESAANETVFREMNEWAAEANDSRANGGGPDTYLCECSDERCSTPIRLTHTQYESVRSFPVRFAIALNHENPELDSVVAEHLGFAVVEKVGSRATELARASDPRR